MKKLSIALLLMIGCATTKPAEKPAAAEAPAPAPKPAEPDREAARKELIALFSREKEAPAGEQSFQVDGKTLTVEAAKPVVLGEVTEGLRGRFNVNFGTTQDVMCELHGTEISPGVTLTRLIDRIRAEQEVNAIRITDITVVEKAPAVFAELLYLAKASNGEKLLGSLKTMIYAHPKAALFCFQDEPGYSKTFQRVATSIAQSAGKMFVDKDDSIYRAIYVMRLKGMAIGYEAEVWTKAGKGGHQVEGRSANLFPRAATSLASSDHQTSSTYDGAGYLQMRASVGTSGETLEEQLELSHTKGSAYTYKGMLQGKELSGDLKTTDPKGLPSDRITNRLIKEQVLTGKKPTVVVDSYAAKTNPTAVTPVTIKKADTGPNDVTINVGPLELHTTTDASGAEDATSFTAGPVTIERKRVFVQGSTEWR